jgi:hypothetical protein
MSAPIGSGNHHVISVFLLLAVLVALGALGVCYFRDDLSLLFWRAWYHNRYRSNLPTPSVLLQPSGQSDIFLTLLGGSEKLWRVSHEWAPAELMANVLAANNAIITVGCWWDDFHRVTALPTDDAGQFTQSVLRRIGLSNTPLQNQIAFKICKRSGMHRIVPPRIGNRGDGFLLLLLTGGIDADDPIRDSGQSRLSHRPFGPGDPKAIQAISVETDDELAQKGDLAIAIFSIDPYENPDMQISLPEGWVSLGYNDNAVLNIGYRACFKIVTKPGRQSATCSWKDNSTFVAEATIAVFKARHPR